MEVKHLWKAFVFLFLIMLLLFNWANVSWVFNYKAVSGFFSDLFEKEEIKQNILPIEPSGEIVLNNREEYYDKENSLEISKIEISAPLVFAQSADQSDMQKALNTGVVFYPGSAFPGKSGQTIILGHSAPAGWPKIRYDGIFTRLNELIEGDEVIIYFNNRKYSYIVSKKVFLERGEEISQEGFEESDNVLVLISCWPPGKDIRRIAVQAKLSN